MDVCTIALYRRPWISANSMSELGQLVGITQRVGCQQYVLVVTSTYLLDDKQRLKEIRYQLELNGECP